MSVQAPCGISSNSTSSVYTHSATSTTPSIQREDNLFDDRFANKRDDNLFETAGSLASWGETAGSLASIGETAGSLAYMEEGAGSLASGGIFA